MHVNYLWLKYEEYEINLGLRIESNQNLEMKRKTMKENIRKLQVQRTMWKSHNINSLCWVFLCVNDNKDVDVNAHKPWDVFFVTIVQFCFVTLKPKQGKV
jgi:hypothetical protein